MTIGFDFYFIALVSIAFVIIVSIYKGGKRKGEENYD